jgi:hypothetical protein
VVAVICLTLQIYLHILNGRFFYPGFNPHCKYVVGTLYAAQKYFSGFGLRWKEDSRWLSLEICHPLELGRRDTDG